MAYPAVPAPYGFRPVNSVDGKPYAGATRQLRISPTQQNGFSPVTADPLFYGDVVEFEAYANATNGSRLVRYTGTGYGVPYGVFVGCTFINPVTKQPTWSQFYPGPAAAPDAIAYIVDDPMALYKVVATGNLGETSTEVVYPTQYWAIGMALVINIDFNGVDGSTNSGDSYMSVVSPSFSWSSLDSGLHTRVIDVVPETATDSGYVELLVRLQPNFIENPTVCYPTLLL
jgi:hypothetical protein